MEMPIRWIDRFAELCDALTTDAILMEAVGLRLGDGAPDLLPLSDGRLETVYLLLSGRFAGHARTLGALLEELERLRKNMPA